jgi:hypothetical protein
MVLLDAPRKHPLLVPLMEAHHSLLLLATPNGGDNGSSTRRLTVRFLTGRVPFERFVSWCLANGSGAGSKISSSPSSGSGSGPGSSSGSGWGGSGGGGGGGYSDEAQAIIRRRLRMIFDFVGRGADGTIRGETLTSEATDPSSKVGKVLRAYRALHNLTSPSAVLR